MPTRPLSLRSNTVSLPGTLTPASFQPLATLSLSPSPWKIRPLCNHPSSWSVMKSFLMPLTFLISTNKPPCLIFALPSSSASLKFLSELLGRPEVTKSGNHQFQELGGSALTSNLPSWWVDIQARQCNLWRAVQQHQPTFQMSLSQPSNCTFKNFS